MHHPVIRKNFSVCNVGVLYDLITTNRDECNIVLNMNILSDVNNISSTNISYLKKFGY